MEEENLEKNNQSQSEGSEYEPSPDVDKKAKKAMKRKLPTDANESTPKMQKTLQRKNIANDLEDYQDTTQIEKPSAESTRMSQLDSQVDSEASNLTQGSSQNGSTQGDKSNPYIKVITSWLSKKNLAIDFIFNSESMKIIELNNKNSSAKKANPLRLEYLPQYCLIDHKCETEKAESIGLLLSQLSKDKFRELLFRHPKHFGLAQIGSNHETTLQKHWVQSDNSQNLPFRYWFLQIVQVKGIVDEEYDLNQEDGKFNPTTGKIQNP